MEATLSAREAAERAYGNIGRPRLGSQKTPAPAESKKRERFLPVALMVLFAILLSWWQIRDSNIVKGWAVRNGFALKNAKLTFRSKNGQYYCLTDSEGDFFIRLPSGRYSIYFLGDQSPIKSPSVLNCESDTELRVFFPEAPIQKNENAL